MSELNRSADSNEAMESSPDGGSACSRPSCRQNRWVLLVGVLAVGAIYLYSQRPAGPSAVDWRKDYERGMAEAQQSGQRVLLAFKARWCPPCKQMDRDVFTQKAAANALADFVPIQIDVDDERRIADRFDVTELPTFIVLTSEGKPLTHQTGGMVLEEFVAFLASTETPNDNNKSRR